MKDQALILQSKTAYNQWCVQWRAHAIQHSEYKHKPFSDFLNVGIGKACLLVANGYSFEEEIETIKKNKENVDIFCCDKTLGHLLDHGIIPKYCMVCDANVNYQRYMEKWKDQLKDTILLMNVCANPEWSKNGNWKDKYFFVNIDVIDSHKEFSQLSGCNNMVPAATNVSNAMLVMLSQSDNTARRNYFGYDKMLLIGFDYSWRHDGKYYAFNKTGDGKDKYMRHIYFNTITGKFAYSSGNLVFSRDWIQNYIKHFNLPVVQCSKESLLQLKHSGELDYQMKYGYKPEDRIQVKILINDFNKSQEKLKKIQNELERIGHDHNQAFLNSV